jgi:hypothetical protein
MYLPILRFPFLRYERNHERVVDNIFEKKDRNVLTDITAPHGSLPVLRVPPEQPVAASPKKIAVAAAWLSRLVRGGDSDTV